MLSIATHKCFIVFDRRDRPRKKIKHLESLNLFDCSWDRDDFVNKISRLFPNVQSVVACGRDGYDPPQLNLLSELYDMPSVNEMVLYNLNLRYLMGYPHLRRFIPVSKRNTDSNSCNLKLERVDGQNIWEISDVKRRDFTNIIFDRFKFKKLYTENAWKELFWSKNK